MVGISEESDADKRLVAVFVALRARIIFNLLLVDIQSYCLAVTVKVTLECIARRSSRAAYGSIFAIDCRRDIGFLFFMIFTTVSTRRNSAYYSLKRRSGVIEIVRRELKIISLVAFGQICSYAFVIVGIKISIRNSIGIVGAGLGAVYRSLKDIKVLYIINNKRVCRCSFAAAEYALPLGVESDVVDRLGYDSARVIFIDGSVCRKLAEICNGVNRVFGAFTVRLSIPLLKGITYQCIGVERNLILGIRGYLLIIHLSAEGHALPECRRVIVECDIIGIFYPYRTHADLVFGIEISQISVIVILCRSSVYLPAYERVSAPRGIA